MGITTQVTLYNLEENLLALLDTEEMVEDKETHLEILDDIAKAGEAAVAKRDNLIHFLRHLDLQQGNIDTEITRLKALKDSYAKGQKRVETYVVSVIERFAPEPKRGPKKLEGSIGVLSLRKNPDSVEIELGGESEIPMLFKDIKLKLAGEDYQELLGMLARHDEDRLLEAVVRNAEHAPRKTDIKKALQAGREVEGCDLVYGKNRLAIR